MGNICTCCNWGRDSKTGQQKKMDAWFEQDSMPLMSAKHGPDDIGSDEADGTLKRKVLIRSPRPTSTTTTSEVDERSSRQHTPRHHQKEMQYRTHRISTSSSRHFSRRSNRGNDEERPRSHHRHSHRDEDSDDRPRHERRTVRSSSLEVQDSTREMRSPSSPSARSPRATSYSQDASSFADDEVESVDSTRSHRSSSASSSPKASSRSGSPQKQQRYGRKHYRATRK